MESSLSSSSKSVNSIIKEDGVMDEYIKSLRESIENEIKNEFKENESFAFSFREIKENNSFLIKVKINKFTDENPFDTEIYFYVRIDSKFPESAPYVTCNTNFCFPSLFDNRDLFSSIVPYQWQNNSKLSNVILGIPKFINKYTLDIRSKILTYYGEYKLNEFYDVNDFLLNPENAFFKLEVELNTMMSSNREITIVKEWRYFIITEIYLLVFTPCQGICCDKSKAKLSFIGELKEIINFKSVKNFGGEKGGTVGIVLEWENNSPNFQRKNLSFDNVILMSYEKNKKFEEVIETRSKTLLENFTIFHDDINKLNTSMQEIMKINEENAEKIEELIVYKESLLGINKENDEQITKDLMTMYQKIIEIYSARSDETYLIYMKKLQQMLIEIDNKGDSNSFTLLN